VDGNEECDGGLHCSRGCLLPRVSLPCAYLVCDPVPLQEAYIDVITWVSTYCICQEFPPTCTNITTPLPALSPPDNIHGGDDQHSPDRNKCNNYEDHVVCPEGLYDTHGLGYWLAIIGGFIFISVVLSYVGSFV
jgi:hypothetical protein